METRVVDELGVHAAAWDRLVEQMPLPSPFLRSWWLAHVATGDARYVLVFQDDELLGGMALQRSVKAGVEWLRFVGTGPLEPDHLDVVAAPSHSREVIEAVRQWLGRPGDRVIDLVGVRTASWALDAVPGRGGVTSVGVAPYVLLPPDAAAFLPTRGGRTRSTVTRSAKRLAREGVTFEVVDASSPPERVPFALDALASLHDGRWGDESDFLGAWDAFAAAAVAGVAAGELRFHLLVAAEGDAVAVEVDFVVAGRMSFYQAGRSTDHALRGAGSVLRHDVIRSAIESGCTEFDLLRGDEPYKQEWADHRRGLLRIRRGVGPRGRAIVAAARANATVQARRRVPAVAPVASRRATVAFYTDAAQIGGAESVATTLLAGLDERFRVVVMGTDRRVVEHLAAVRPSASVLVLPPIDDRSDVAAMAAHRRALRALRPDVFHANLSEGSSCQYALLAALSVPGVRVVVTENSPMGVRSELSRRIKRWSAPRFDAHIGVGERAAHLVEADIGLPSGSVQVIPNAVTVYDHPPRPDAPPAGPVQLVAVSRFDPVKGLDVLVRAMAALPPAADVALTVFGDGPERPQVERLIDELGLAGRITLAGWADDVRAQLVRFDVFVLPSRLEGLPMSLLEAMQAGVAAIATDVGSVGEVVEDGRSGRVVPPDDPEALAAAIAELAADPAARSALAVEGRRVALERFTSTAKVASYEAVYDRVLAGPPRRSFRIR